MKYNFNKKRRRILLDFYENPNQTLRQLAARHQTNISNVSKILTEFFRLRKSRAALIKHNQNKPLSNKKIKKTWKNNLQAR